MPRRASLSDEVETTRPASLSFLLHADDKIEKFSDHIFSIDREGVRLLIDAMLDGPNSQFQSLVETNTVTAPGPPGAVDKGERQARGLTLVLTTGQISKGRFVERLKIESR